MKARIHFAHSFCLALMLALVSLALAGCKSTPKVDWNTRIGTFTYDQAVAELGPPDKTATLTDGRTVADWIKRRSGGFSFGVGTGYSSGHSGVGVGQSVSTGFDDKVLRLTFDADNKLAAWSKNY
jgi:hypothetical protein